MNWTNFDILARDLNTLKGTTPEMFDYTQGYSLTDPGCVDCRCRILMGNAHFKGSRQGIMAFLKCSQDEAKELWLPYSNGTHPYPGETSGVPGIENALHRLKTLADKYHHAWPLDQPFVGDEAAFLTGVRQLASEPVSQ